MGAVVAPRAGDCRPASAGGLALLVALIAACSGHRPSGDAPSTAAAPSAPVAPVEMATVARRAAHTASSLPDGRVLVAGGCVVDGCVTASAATFVIAADGQGAVPGPTLASARDSHTATVLSDGRLVLAGGYAGEAKGVLGSVEVVDRGAAMVAYLTDLRTARGGHAAARLPDGRVLVAGGWVGPGHFTDSVELIDPTAAAVAAAGALAWAADGLDAVALADGRVFVTGGQVRRGAGTAQAAVFDPATGSWRSVAAMATPRFKHLSVRLADGRVLVVGGTTDDTVLLATTELFDPATETFTPGPTLHEPRYKLTGGAVVLADGRVLVASGGRTAEVVDVTAGTSTTVQRFRATKSFATLNALGSGDLLVLGGYDDRIRLDGEAVLLSPAAFG